MATSEQFENVIFPDESTINWTPMPVLSSAAAGKMLGLDLKQSIQCQSIISARIGVLSGIMDSIGYCEILKEELSHFVKRVYLVPLFKAKNLCKLHLNNYRGITLLLFTNLFEICFVTGLNCGRLT